MFILFNDTFKSREVDLAYEGLGSLKQRPLESHPIPGRWIICSSQYVKRSIDYIDKYPKHWRDKNTKYALP